MATYKISQKLIAEFLETFALVSAGCGSAVIAGDEIGYMGVSFTFGFALMAMYYAVGTISGGHLNPVVTVSLLYMKRISSRDALLYVITQIAAGIAACGVLYLVLQGNPDYNIATDGLSANGYGRHSPGGYNMVSAILAELVLGMFFILTLLGATSKNANKDFTGLALGAALIMIHLLSIPITNTSVNPARSIGPAVIQGGWALAQVWLFIIVPTVGGLLGAIVFKNLIESRSDED